MSRRSREREDVLNTTSSANRRPLPTDHGMQRCGRAPREERYPPLVNAFDDHMRVCSGSGREVVTTRQLDDGSLLYLVFEPGKEKVKTTRRMEDGAPDINWLTKRVYGHLCQKGYDRGLAFGKEWELEHRARSPKRGHRYDFPIQGR